jgi:hypothetical protein
MLEALTARGAGRDGRAGCAFFAITSLRRTVAACVVGAHSVQIAFEAPHHAFRSVKIKSNFRQGFVKVGIRSVWIGKIMNKG